MRAVLALGLITIFCATSAHAWVHDVGKGGHWPPDEEEWDRNSYFDYAHDAFAYTVPGKERCETEGRNILDGIAKIRADPGLKTRSDVVDGRDTGGHANATNNTRLWQYFWRWQNTRCTEEWVQTSSDPINSADSSTYIHRYVLEGYIPVHKTARSGTVTGPAEVPRGTWDVRTAKGEHFVLALEQDGESVSGTIKTDAGASGSVSGRLYGKRMLKLQYSLPTASGEVVVLVKGDSFQGPGDVGKGWSGMRLPGPAEPFGTWIVHTNRGRTYVMMLTRSDARLFGTISEPGVSGATALGGALNGQSLVLTVSVSGRPGYVIGTLSGNSFSGADPVGLEAWQGVRQ